MHGQPNELLVTVLWLAAPGLLAALCAVLLLAVQGPSAATIPPPAVGLLVVPVMVLWLLRGTLRR